jgi:glycosyltransferase involved in cell wall biosynthesis
MAKKKHIGLLFSYNEDWIGGSYYILNLIHALNKLSKDQKPSITIISPKMEDYELVKKETNYPDLFYFCYPKTNNMLVRSINKISRLLLKKNVLIPKTNFKDIDFIYPSFPKNTKDSILKKAFWIADFQEAHLPHLFSEEEILLRKKNQKYIADYSDIIVFSSKNAQKDFNKLYVNSKPKQFVLPFAVTHPDFSDLNAQQTIKEYQLPENYFFAPNQFWEHKNHILILKAIKLLKEQNKEVFIAFSGKENDYRNKDYIGSIKQYVKDHKLEKNIIFLGFLDRKVQVLLMNNSKAIIQPSLFEGWSTVVEDAKALNKHIILSDLEVHQEQISSNCSFFNPSNVEQLASLLDMDYSLTSKNNNLNYSNSICQFGAKFMEIVDDSSQ